jgi:SynChlorMet cassette radical SAM/SPASM protein ScmE
MKVELPPVFDPTVPPPDLKTRPKNVEISITGRCNLKCGYCFYADEMAALSDLPTERWLACFQELGELAVQRVTLSGGEVFTRPDLFELIDGLIANRMRYSILSNGTLITEKTIEQFGVGKRRLRLDSIQVSIDGSCAEVHNKSRPPDSFDRALRGLHLLKAAGFPVTVRVTINRHNVDDLENVARLLIEDVGLRGFSTNEAEQMGSARCYGQDVVLTEEERQCAMAALTAINERYGGRIAAQAGPLSRARHFAEIAERVARGETGMPGRGTLCSCGGVFTKMAILHDGTMVPCNLLPTLTMGVVGVNRIQEAWLYHPSINVVRHRRQIPLSALESCHDCPYTGFCTGGCPASVMAKYGRLNVIDPVICYRSYLGEGS